MAVADLQACCTLPADQFHCELAQVATQVALAAVDEIHMAEDNILDAERSRGAGEVELSLKKGAAIKSSPTGLSDKETVADAVLATTVGETSTKGQDTVAVKSPVHPLMDSVPTPSRSPNSVKRLPGDGTPSGRSGVVVNRFGMSNHAARGPEPWCMRETAGVPQQALAPPKGGYRERLQARGQQAMQRLQMTGPPGAPNWNAAPAAPAPPAPLAPSSHSAPAPPALSPQQLGVPPPSPVVSWGVSNEMQMQQAWFSGAGMEMSPLNGHQSHMVAYSGCDLQLPMVPPFPPLMLDSSGQQLAYGGCQQGPITPMNSQPSPMSYGQQTPMGFNVCQQGFGTPMCGQQSPMSSQMSFQMASPVPQTPIAGQLTPKPCSQEEFMIAQMMPGAFGLDGAQIAHQLRAAAPEVYDD